MLAERTTVDNVVSKVGSLRRVITPRRLAATSGDTVMKV